MRNIRVFISSVQVEFAEERMLLCEYIRSDVLLGKFFVPFILKSFRRITGLHDRCICVRWRCVMCI